MSLELTRGDILKSDADWLVCPVNCKGTMGAGLAKRFAATFRGLENEYRSWCKVNRPEPGDVYCIQMYERSPLSSRPRYVVCLPTKDDWRKPSELSYIEDGLEHLGTLLYVALTGVGPRKPVSVAIPALGCGLGGLRWSDVLPVIRTEVAKWPESIRVEVFAPQERT